MTDTNAGHSPMALDGKGSRFCFICGSPMIESWRSVEKTSSFIWFECSQPGCDQTYLVREFVQSGPVLDESACNA